MNTSVNNFDSLERLIYEEGISIKAVDIHKDLDLMLVILSTKTILKRTLSSYKRLKTASEKDLKHYQLIGKGTGIRWPKLDEDLSLKGFLKEEIRLSVGSRKKVITA